MTDFTWVIEQLETYAERNGRAKVISKLHWRLVGSEGGRTASCYGSSVIAEPGNAFTPFEAVTEAQVIGWLEAALGEDDVAAYRETVSKQLVGSLAPAASPSLPWVEPDLAALKAQGKARVDVAAGEARLKYITDAPGQELTYDRKRREALQAIDDPTPTAQKYPVLAASIGIEVPTTGNAKADFDAVCALVISRETAWAAAASQIEALRLGGKQAVEAATSPAQVAETVSTTETALKAL